MKGALKTKVEQNAEQIRFSKFLATIVTDVPISFEAATCERKEVDKERLREIYVELEFRTFLNKLNDAPTAEHTEKGTAAMQQLSLFGDDTGQTSPVDTQPDPEEVKVSDLADLTTTPHSYFTADTEAKRNDLARLLRSQSSFAFDTETDGVDPLTAHLVGMSFAINEYEAWYVPLPADTEETKRIIAPFAEALQHPAIEKVGQNIKFDLLMLRRYGIQVAGPLFDTMIAHYLLNPELRHNMDYLAETYLRYRPIPIV